MRMAMGSQRLRSTQGMDIELTLITVVAEPMAPLATSIAAEVPDGVSRCREESEGVGGMGGMRDERRQLSAASVEGEVAGPAGVHPAGGLEPAGGTWGELVEG
ncbi:hypothetical protein V6N11_023208 [Hibiscus sabdariffa]|uniref:Uncharacterized protein n=1 Tax=Hibiscus sabdariffa TaxID=183260 RepID=A0ABR2TLS2_9ROSI